MLDTLVNKSKSTRWWVATRVCFETQVKSSLLHIIVTMIFCYNLIRRWNKKLDILRIPTAHLNCNLYILLRFEHNQIKYELIASNFDRRLYCRMLSGVSVTKRCHQHQVAKFSNQLSMTFCSSFNQLNSAVIEQVNEWKMDHLMKHCWRK